MKLSKDLILKKLYKFPKILFTSLSIYLLYRLFNSVKFSKLDHILIVILGLAGLLIIIKEEVLRRKNEKTAS